MKWLESKDGSRSRWLLLAAAITTGIVGWEYALNAVMNPEVDWNLLGVAAHLALDLAFLLPLTLAALAGGLWLARRLGFDRREAAGLLGAVGAVGLVFLVAVLPLTATRDIAHEWVGTTYGLSLAEVQTTVVRSDLTVQESTQLCSFGSLRNPSLAREDYQDLQATVLMRLTAGIKDALIQLAAIVPLLLLGLVALFRRELPAWNPAPAVEALRWWGRPLRLGTLGLGVFVLFCVGYGTGDGPNLAIAQGAAPNACTDGGPLKEYDVSAIDVTITLNRWGDHVDNAFMYALDANVPEILDFQDALEADRELPEGPGVARVSQGLRQDPIQPLVIRANLGDCLRINFTNQLKDGSPASLHILGLPHSAANAGSAVGQNPDTMAGPNETVTYEIPIPDDPNAERAYYFHDHGAGRRRQNMGLFGAIVAEPKGATYLDVETGEPLDTVTGSNWEAIIIDPNLDGRPDGKSFREFVVFYHEIGNEAFTDIRDRDGKLQPLVDEIAGIYRPAARALNYRSEPFRQRMNFDKEVNKELAGNGKALGYGSFGNGDPGTPMPRSYVGEANKTRLMHGGSEVFHVHHLHGGGDRWRRNPNADPNNDFWKGLTKVPDPNLTSIHLDSQSIGPGTSYNLEHECGAGGCQQGVGDFLFHCHIGHHYIAGMWSFWRVFGTVQTAETNVNGFPLFVEPRLFQADNPFSDNEAPSNTPPLPGVSAGELLGTTVDDNKVLVTTVTDPDTEIAIQDWIRQQLPPSGKRLNNVDATVLDWLFDGSGAGLRVLKQPEPEPIPGYVSPVNPGERLELRFNPKNARVTWPPYTVEPGGRPPFTARHTGAPWLGEEMKAGRYDGLCAMNGVHPGVDVGQRTKRFYPVSSITLPIQVTSDRTDPDGMIFVLNEEEALIRNGQKAAEPLAIRSNVGDCVEIILTNKIPDGPLNKDFSKTNIHSHFVQFDTQASDGVITGFSYEQSVRPIETEGRVLLEPAGPGDSVIRVNETAALHPELGQHGIWIGIGLGTGTCGTTADGQPEPCTEIRQIAGINEATGEVTLNEPLLKSHAAGQAVGVEFVRYHWYSDVDFGTVFFHTHVEFKDWDHGLFGAHIVEPKGSTYHDPFTGEEVRAGTLVDIRVDPAAGGNPVAHNVDGSFREFMLFLHNNSPVEGRFTRGGGTINLRAEPWRLRGDPASRFSSVTHDDPFTQELRAYVGDPIIVRGMGLVERVGGVRFTGHRFHMERNTDKSDTRDTTYIGISERFDFSLEPGAGGPAGLPGDYLYYSTTGRDFEAGAWGILRVHDTLQGNLQPLPDRDLPPGGAGFPQLTHTGGAPPSLDDGPGAVCPGGAPVKEYDLAIDDVTIIHNAVGRRERSGVAYQPADARSGSSTTPAVLRVNAGECLRVNLTNDRSVPAGLSVGELPADPQRSYGVAIGFNYDSAVAPGQTRTYEYYADRELGIVLAVNLAGAQTIERGAFASVVVEPEGAQYFRAGRNEPLPQGGMGVQADIVVDGVTTREVVALFNSQDKHIGASSMPYPDGVKLFNSLNYSAEPLSFRGLKTSPADVFRTDLWGDPRHVVAVPAGTPLVYRVANSGGQQVHVPTLEGHRYFMEPGMEGSEQIFNDVLAPGMSLNLHFVGGAGSDPALTGDYLFLDRRQPFLEGGLWHILRSTDGPVTPTDSVNVFFGFSSGGQLTVLGDVGIRAAGDRASELTVHAGGAAGGSCAGAVLGTVNPDPGSGSWVFSDNVGAAPGEVCVASLGGGVGTGNVF